MVTLLMVFFVMLMATGETKIVKTLIILSAFEGKLGVLKGGQTFTPGDLEYMAQDVESLPSARKGRSLERAIKKALSIFKPEIRAKKIRVTEDERGIVISLMADLLFEPGSAEIRIRDVQNILENLRLLISSETFKNKIRLEGHTDERPYTMSDYKDNWDLSAQRAWAVLNALRMVPSLHDFDETRVSIHGYGSTRPIEPNDTPEGRAYNRRVDIILLRDSI